MLLKQLARFTLPLIGGLIALLSFSYAGSAYLFPHVLAITLLIMAIADGILEFSNSKMNIEHNIHLKHLLLGLCFIFSYIVFSESIGFYLGGVLFMLATIMYYEWVQAKQQQTSIQFIKHLIFVISFGVIMYLLFTVMLKVQVPQGILL